MAAHVKHKKSKGQKAVDKGFAATGGVAPGALSNKTLSEVARRLQESLGTVFAKGKKKKK